MVVGDQDLADVFGPNHARAAVVVDIICFNIVTVTRNRQSMFLGLCFEYLNIHTHHLHMSRYWYGSFNGTLYVPFLPLRKLYKSMRQILGKYYERCKQEK